MTRRLNPLTSEGLYCDTPWYAKTDAQLLATAETSTLQFCQRCYLRSKTKSCARCFPKCWPPCPPFHSNMSADRNCEFFVFHEPNGVTAILQTLVPDELWLKRTHDARWTSFINCNKRTLCSLDVIWTLICPLTCLSDVNRCLCGDTRDVDYEIYGPTTCEIPCSGDPNSTCGDCELFWYCWSSWAQSLPLCILRHVRFDGYMSSIIEVYLLVWNRVRRRSPKLEKHNEFFNADSYINTVSAKPNDLNQRIVERDFFKL